MRRAASDYVDYFLHAEWQGCADNGYYGEGALWNVSEAGMIRQGEFTAEGYGNWLDGKDPQSGELRGGKVTEGGVQGYEFAVTVPQRASLVAALNKDLGAVVMRAQERAAGFAAGRAMPSDE